MARLKPDKIGEATLWQADCRDVLERRGLPKIDLVVTDPPYSSGARTDSERQVRGKMLRHREKDYAQIGDDGAADADWFSHDAMTTWGFGWFARSVFGALRPKLSGGAHVYVFCDWRQTPTVYGMLEATGYRVNHCLVWRKLHFGMGAYWRNQHENIVFASNGQPADMLDRGRGSVIDAAAVAPTDRVHPTEKPIGMLRDMIKAVPGQVVFDPFMGSGSTGIAALQNGRRFLGCEINPGHYSIARQRIAQARLVAPPNATQQELFDDPSKRRRTHGAQERPAAAGNDADAAAQRG